MKNVLKGTVKLSCIFIIWGLKVCLDRKRVDLVSRRRGFFIIVLNGIALFKLRFSCAFSTFAGIKIQYKFKFMRN